MLYELEYQARLARDLKKVREKARKEGLEEGREEAREKAREEARKESRAEAEESIIGDILNSLTAKGYSKADAIATTVELTHFTADEITLFYDKLFEE